jgi:hypothetical protein
MESSRSAMLCRLNALMVARKEALKNEWRMFRIVSSPVSQREGQAQGAADWFSQDSVTLNLKMGKSYQRADVEAIVDE